jgi:hypothetical protein
VRALLAAAVLALAPTARADDAAPAPAPPRRTPFDQGRVGLSAGAGEQTNFNENYIWIGASAGYFVLDGFELGLSGLHEFGSGPSISQLSPWVRYVAQPLVGKWPVVPYVGAFYDHWFVGGSTPSIDGVGARAGLLYVSGSVVLGLGAAYEHELDGCGTDCDLVYPDVTIGLSL